MPSLTQSRPPSKTKFSDKRPRTSKKPPSQGILSRVSTTTSRHPQSRPQRALQEAQSLEVLSGADWEQGVEKPSSAMLIAFSLGARSHTCEIRTPQAVLRAHRTTLLRPRGVSQLKRVETRRRKRPQPRMTKTRMDGRISAKRSPLEAVVKHKMTEGFCPARVT